MNEWRKRLGVIEGIEFAQKRWWCEGGRKSRERQANKKDVKSRGNEEKGVQKKKRCRSRISLITADKVIDNS